MPGLVMVWSDTCRQSAGRASAQQAAPAQHAGGDVAEVRVVRGKRQRNDHPGQGGGPGAAEDVGGLDQGGGQRRFLGELRRRAADAAEMLGDPLCTGCYAASRGCASLME